jgi:hypothetical protein
MNDGFGLKGKVEWKLFDKDGNLKDSGGGTNIVSKETKTKAIDALATGTWNNPLESMAVGTGSGHGEETTTIIPATSIVSHVASEATCQGLTISQPSDEQLQAVGTFTAWGCGAVTITEGCLSGHGQASDHLYCYNDDDFNVNISDTNDTLTVTWTLTVS